MSLMEILFGKKEKIDFKEIVKNGAIILVVRSPVEYSSGHIPGSLNIALKQNGSTISSLKQKNKPLIMVCRSGT